MRNKAYLYKVYDKNGVFITTWRDVIGEPSFSVNINAGYSEMKVSLARSIFAYGEGEDVTYSNKVKVYCFDAESGQNGVLVYSGFIDQYEPIVDGAKESIEIVLVSFWYQLNQYLIEGDGNGIDAPIYGNGYTNDVVPQMTANNAPSPIVVSSSGSYSATYDPWMAFNNALTDAPGGFVSANGSVACWIKIDFGAGVTKKIQKYTLNAQGSARPNMDEAPKNWTLEGSNTGAFAGEQTILDTQTNQQDWMLNEKRVFTFENDVAFRYYRFNVSANNGFASFTSINELELMESVAFSRVGATRLKYLTQDPSAILKDLLDKFTGQGGVLDYAGGTVDLTGTSATYEFNTNTFQEGVKKIPELCPENWYLRIGADDLVYLKQKSATPIHTFTIGGDVTYYKSEKRLDNIVNYIYFIGKDGLYKKYINTGSVSAYGRYVQKLVDGRVSRVETADIMANNILNRMSSPEIRIVLKVMDSNSKTTGKGYDIESIKVGDTCKIRNATKKGENKWDDIAWDVDAWDYSVTNEQSIMLQIQKIEYHPDYVLLEISNRQPDIAKRIEDINRNLVDSITTDNNVAPTT